MVESCSLIRGRKCIITEIDFVVDAKAVSGAYFGKGASPILLTDVECLGHEDYLVECPANIGEVDCSHGEDAGVICIPT